MIKPFIIAHLYPQEMNIYGDYGNIIALTKRLEWRGLEAVVRPVEIGEPFDFSSVDIVFGGGGQDRGQLLVGDDLRARGPELRAAATDGLPMLLVCGLYQLFGHGFMPSSGKEIPGIGVFDAHTTAGAERLIGNITLDTPMGRVVGFENHSGVTTLASGQEPFGRVVSGYGNGPAHRRTKRFEGAITNHVIGTYLHGPILPKNRIIADTLITWAQERRGGGDVLTELPDELEIAASLAAQKRPQ